MKIISIAIMAIMIVLNFQNCSPSHVGNSSGSFSLASIYPYYSEKPEYFESVQLTEIEEGVGTWKYQFIVTLVYIDDPSQDVDFEVQIFNESDALLCPSKSFTVNQNTNHIVIDDCISAVQATTAKITVSAKLASATSALVPIKNYVFSLE